jgi:hypothetical protein
MLVTEMRTPAIYDFVDMVPLGAEHVEPYPHLKIKPFRTAKEAERKFLQRFRQLYKG